VGGGSRHCATLTSVSVPVVPLPEGAEHCYTSSGEFALGLYAPSHAHEQPCPAPIVHPDEQSSWYAD